jgi:hypothetical protein
MATANHSMCPLTAHGQETASPLLLRAGLLVRGMLIRGVEVDPRQSLVEERVLDRLDRWMTGAVGAQEQEVGAELSVMERDGGFDLTRSFGMYTTALFRNSARICMKTRYFSKRVHD